RHRARQRRVHQRANGQRRDDMTPLLERRMARTCAIGPAIIAIVLLILSPGSARAGSVPPIDLGPPLILRLDGALEATAQAARGPGIDVVSMRSLGGGDTTLRYLGASDARTIGGDHFLFGKDVLAMVAPFWPNFLLTGPPAMLDRIAQLPPH